MTFLRGCCLLILAGFLVAPSAHAASGTWNGTTSTTWSVSTNWSATPVPGTGDTATFGNAGNGNLVLNLGSGVTIKTLSFNTGAAAAYTIGSGAVGSQALTLNSSAAITLNSTVSANQLVNAALVLGNDGTAQTSTLTNGSTTNLLTVAGGLTGSTGAGLKTLAVAGAGATTLSGIIGNGTGGGAVALSKSGAGTLTLSNTASTYSGGLTMGASAGTVVANAKSGTNVSALGTGAVLIGTGSTMQLININTTGGGANTVFVGNNFTGTGTLKVSFADGDNGRSSTLTGVSGFSGLIQLSNTGSTGDKLAATLNAPSATLQIDAGSTAYFSGSPATFAAYSIAGSGNAEGFGAIRVSNATVKGPIILKDDSTLGLQSSTAVIAGAIQSGAAGTQTLTIGATASGTSSGTITGAIGGGAGTINLVKPVGNTGITVLSGANTYTGTTTINSGTLQAGIASVAGISGALGKNSAVTMADVANTTLDITGFDTQIGSITGGGATGGNVTLGAATLTTGGDNTSPAAYAGVISGTGGIRKIGLGTLTLTGANNFTGALTVTQGSVALGSGSLVPASRIVVSNGATVQLTYTGINLRVAALSFNGTTEPNGTYGAIGSGAQLTRAYLIGPGRLIVGVVDVAQQNAEFFKLINFNNPSLISHNSSLTPVKNELAKPSPDYITALSLFWSGWSPNAYVTSPSIQPSSSAAFAQTFFSWINLDYPGLENVKTLVNAGQYATALDAWRDYTVDKFRRMELPIVYGQTGQSAGVKFAQYLLGEISNADYYGNTSNGFYFIDIYGIGGAPGATPAINWLGDQSKVDLTTYPLSYYDYDGFNFANSLIYRYHTGPTLPGGSGSALTLSGSGKQVVAGFGAAHGLQTGDYLQVSSATPAEYNGIFKVTVTDSTHVSYQMPTSVTAAVAGGSNRKAVRTRELAAITKWFEVVADFCANQKNAVAAKQFQDNATNRAAYPTVYGLSDWSTVDGAALGMGGRVGEFASSLGLWCKLLPDATPVARSWSTESFLPNNAPLAPGAAQIIPSEKLARLCLSLVADHPEPLLLKYLKPNAVPNQRLTGLKALYTDTCILPEFKSSPGLRTVTDTAIGNYSNEVFYPEGAMLERSPNYNLSDSDSARLVASLAENSAEGITLGVDALRQKILLYERVTAYMQRPIGELPRMASYSGSKMPALWLGSSTINSWRSSFLQQSFLNATDPAALDVYDSLLDSGSPVPAATSVAFPSAGYYMMRNGWQTRAHFLYFANTPTGRGHAQRDVNAIQITAFGREFLTSGGIPPYNLGLVADSQKDDYDGFAAYLGENSSYKCNTVLVDGRSQSNYGRTEPVTTDALRPNPWFTSAEFDYVEGTYNQSYGSHNAYSPLLPSGDTNSELTGITHKRAAIFLRRAGLWVVVDQIDTGTTARSFRQVWNFPGKDDPAAPLGLSGLNGFLPAEVTVNAGTQTIKTTASGPNIALHHLGPGTVTYETFSGSRSPYAGWYGIGFGGVRVPTKSVHAVFSGSGTTTLVTVLAPRDTGSAGPVTGEQFTNGPLASTTVVDRTFALADGSSARFVQAPSAQSVAVGNRTINATTVLIVTYAGGAQRGLALGCTTSGLPAAFEFVAGPSAFLVESSITTPTEFDWNAITSPPNTAPAISPMPALTMNEDTTSSAKSFVVSDLQSDSSALTVTATSSNPALIPNANLLLTGNAIARAVTLTPVPNQNGTTTITLTAGDGAATTTTSFAVTVTPDPPLTNWKQAWFGSNWQNAAVSGDLVDSDRDGIPNLLEYFLRSSPVAGSPAALAVTRSGSTLTFTYSKNKSATDVTSVVEWSDTLAPNSWSTTGVSAPSLVSDDGTVQILQVTIPAGSGGARFVHLRVTR